MKNSKLIDILKSFTKEESKDLAIYIEHAKVKENTFVQLLFTYLNKQYPEFQEKNIEKEKVFKKLFPTKKYDENKLSKIMSELTKIIEEYIITRQSKSNILSNRIQLLRFYNERNLDKYYLQTEKEIDKLIDEIPMSALSQMLSYQFEEIKLTYSLKHEDRQASYQPIYNKIILFSKGEKLRWENMSHINMFPDLKENNIKSIFYEIHLLIKKLLVEEKKEYIFTIKELFNKHATKIDIEEKREILWLLIEYSIHKSNSGVTEYYHHSFNVYQMLEKYNLLLNIYNTIDLSTYKNFITIALKINEIKAAELFLEKYKDNLLEGVKEDGYNFNKAIILFEKKNYTKVLDLLLFCNFKDVFYKLNQRRLLIKTYYELQSADSSYYNIITDGIVAFKKYLLVVKNLPEKFINLNKNFLKFTDKLLSNNKLTKTEKQKLLDELNKIETVSERNWLEEKINELSTYSK